MRGSCPDRSRDFAFFCTSYSSALSDISSLASVFSSASDNFSGSIEQAVRCSYFSCVGGSAFSRLDVTAIVSHIGMSVTIRNRDVGWTWSLR